MLLSRSGLIAAAGDVVVPPILTDYAPNAVVFDGSTDFLTDVAGLNGAADTKLFTVVLAIKRTALSGSGNFPRIAGGQIGTAGTPGQTRWSFGFEPSDHATVARRDALYFDLRDPAGTLLAYVNSTIPFVAGTWYRVGISANRSTRVYRVRVDNVDRTALPAVTDATDTAPSIDFTTELGSIGARYQGDFRLQAEVADLAIYFDRAIDFNVAAEWERFFAPTTHALKFKGNDGSVPYGVAPVIFMRGPTAFWHQNHGYGEGLVLNGALATSSDPPEGAPMESFELSDVAITVTGTNAVVDNEGSDNWPTVWASDGNQVTCWGDGNLPDASRASMGMARVTAATYAAFVSSPTFAALATTRSSGRGAGVNRITFAQGVIPNAPAAEGGKCYGIQALPGGLLYALVGAQDDDDGDAAGNQDANGQMENLTLIKSANNGATWTNVSAVTWNTNTTLDNAWVLPGALNMGRANGAAQDEYLYWYGAGARPGYTGQSVSEGFAYGSDDMMLVRVPVASVETLASWQVFTGMSGSTPQWSSTFTNWAPLPGLSLTAPLNNQYPNAFYLAEFDEIIVVRNTNGRPDWSVTTATHLQFLRSTSRRPWGPFELVEQFTDWRPYDPDVPGAATSARGMFFFAVPPRWVPKATGTTTKSIATALVYTGRPKGASGTFWDAWNSVPMTLTLTAAGPALSAPVSTVLPSISPTNPAVGELVTASNGTWTGNPAPAFTYQWLRNGASISGATAQTYTVTTADRDAAQPSLAVRVTATNSQGSASATSAEISIAALLDAAPPLPTDITSTIQVTPSTPLSTINNAGAKTKFEFAPGTYLNFNIIPKDGQWFQGVGGLGQVTLTSNQDGTRAFSGSARNVFIQGLTITGYAPAGMGRSFAPIGGNDARAQNAAIEYTGTENDALPGTLINWTTYQCRVTANYGRGINVTNGDWVSQTEISDHGGNGGGGRGFSIKFTDCDIYNNNRWDMNKGDDGAGIKFGGGATPLGDGGPLYPPCKDIKFRRCKIHDNNSHGLWTDWDVFNVEVDHCSIYANAWAAISAEVSAAYWVHHSQIGDNLRGAPGNQWLGAYELNWQSCKRSIVEDNLFACYDNVNSGFCYFSQHQRSGNGSFQGGVYIGHFTCTENTFRRNVILQRAGASAAAPADFSAGGLCTQNNQACTGTACLNNCGTTETGCALLYQDAVPSGGLGVANMHCFVPASTAAHHNVAQDNTWRSAGTPPSFPGGTWGSETGRTTGANPDSFLPDWSVIPTWTTPPGKL